MIIYDLDSKHNRLHAYVELNRALTQAVKIYERPISARELAEHLGSRDVDQVAYMLFMMSKYGAVHRQKIERRTENSPRDARYRHWNTGDWGVATSKHFGMPLPTAEQVYKNVRYRSQQVTKAVARKAVKSYLEKNHKKMLVKPIPALSNAQISSLSDDQLSVTFDAIAREVGYRKYKQDQDEKKQQKF